MKNLLERKMSMQRMMKCFILNNRNSFQCINQIIPNSLRNLMQCQKMSTKIDLNLKINNWKIKDKDMLHRLMVINISKIKFWQMSTKLKLMEMHKNSNSRNYINLLELMGSLLIYKTDCRLSRWKDKRSMKLSKDIIPII